MRFLEGKGNLPFYVRWWEKMGVFGVFVFVHETFMIGDASMKLNIGPQLPSAQKKGFLF